MTTVLTLQVKDSEGKQIGTVEITESDVRTITDFIINNYIDDLYNALVNEFKEDDDTLTWLRGYLVSPCTPIRTNTVPTMSVGLGQYFSILFQLQLLNALANSLQPRDMLGETFGALMPLLVLVPLVKALAE